MVVLKENPLLDIKATQSISLVVKGGKAYSINELIQSTPKREVVEKRYEQFVEAFKL